MEITIFKREKDEPACRPFLKANQVSRLPENIIVNTETWFEEEPGVSYFIDTLVPSDSLVLVEFLPNNEMRPPYTFVGKIDACVRCKKDEKPGA